MISTKYLIIIRETSQYGVIKVWPFRVRKSNMLYIGLYRDDLGPWHISHNASKTGHCVCRCPASIQCWDTALTALILLYKSNPSQRKSITANQSVHPSMILLQTDDTLFHSIPNRRTPNTIQGHQLKLQGAMRLYSPSYLKMLMSATTLSTRTMFCWADHQANTIPV